MTTTAGSTAGRRPRVVVLARASVDGKVALTRAPVLMHEPSASVWARMTPPAEVGALRPAPMEDLRTAYGTRAVLEGSGSLVADGDEPTLLAPYDHSFDPAEDYLPDEITGLPSPPYRWFIVVDGRGRVRWELEPPEWNVLVLVSRTTPPAYLASLRRKRICYVVAGDHRVDLSLALVKMRSMLGLDCVLANGGGGINGALLRAGLIDEVCLTISPALVGGLGTPSVMDGEPLQVGEQPTSLRLLSVHADVTGTVQVRYEVTRAG